MHWAVKQTCRTLRQAILQTACRGFEEHVDSEQLRHLGRTSSKALLDILCMRSDLQQLRIVKVGVCPNCFFFVRLLKYIQILNN